MRRLTHVIVMLGLVSSLSLVGCATVLRQGGPEGMMITSDPPTAQVTITDARTHQRVMQAQTPARAALARHAGYMQPARYEIAVTKPGYNPYVTVIEARLDERYFGNLLAGGPVGFFIIDPLTGAMYDLPPRVHAVLTPADGADRVPYGPEDAPYPSQPPPTTEEPPYPYYRPRAPEDRIR